MKPKTVRVLRGMGSILDLSPRTDRRAIIISKDPAACMASHWNNVGRHIRHAIDTFAHEQKEKTGRR